MTFFKVFDDLTGQFFTNDELTDFLCRALHELDGTAEAGCENAIPGSEVTCGHCASCSAAQLLEEIDAETRRRVAIEENAKDVACPTCAAPEGAPCIDDEFNRLASSHPDRRKALLASWAAKGNTPPF